MIPISCHLVLGSGIATSREVSPLSGKIPSFLR
jgi:hypothetical protein